MYKLRLFILAAVTLGLIFIPSYRNVRTQDQAEGEEIQENMDPQFIEVMSIMDDPVLLESLMSDSEFLDVLDKFEEDAGIGEEDIPVELFQEKDAFDGAQDYLNEGAPDINGSEGVQP